MSGTTGSIANDETRLARILVVDDERIQREILREILVAASYDVTTAGGLDDGVRAFDNARAERCAYDLVLTDLKMPANLEGIELLEHVKRTHPDTAVILMTAYSTVESAVRAMKLGALDYLPKPFDKEQLLHLASQALEKLTLVRENKRLRQAVDERQGVRRLIGESAAMKQLFAMIERVARTSSNCLIRGESGTGKELVARALHYGGARQAEPFVAINCAAIPEALIESELFGHERNAFTGAATDKHGRFHEVGNGTIFLDEVGSMRFDLQAKLLRVIQEREFSRVGSSSLIPFRGRVVAATAQNLEQMIANNEFREDLYFRLNVVTLDIPPLRERREDIPVLVEHFLRRCAERLACGAKTIAPEVEELLFAHEWPGNVRELENCIERMMVLADSDVLSTDLLPPSILASSPSAASANDTRHGFDRGRPESLCDRPPVNGERLRGASSNGRVLELPPGGVVLEEMEASLIRQALERSQGRLEPAAQLLGISYKTLQYRIKKYDLRTATRSGGRAE